MQEIYVLSPVYRLRQRHSNSKISIVCDLFQMSPPANIGPLSQRMNQQAQNQSLSLGQSSLSLPSQHKRSLSFNHHLSYNQYTGGNQHQQTGPVASAVFPSAQPQSLPSHPVTTSGPKSTSKTAPLPFPPQLQPQPPPLPPALPISTNLSTNAKNAKGNTKGKERKLVLNTFYYWCYFLNWCLLTFLANWSINNLRPSPPLRLNLCETASGSGGNPAYCNGGGRKSQPTFEEDALVLRVFEAYCAAYQSTVRNTIHSGK